MMDEQGQTPKFVAGRIRIAASEFLAAVHQHYQKSYHTAALKYLAEAIADRDERIKAELNHIDAMRDYAERRALSEKMHQVYKKSVDRASLKDDQSTVDLQKVCVFLKDIAGFTWDNVGEMIGVSRTAAKNYYNGKPPRSLAGERYIKDQIERLFRDREELRIRYKMSTCALKPLRGNDLKLQRRGLIDE